MKKTILIGISALVLAFTNVVKADFNMSGYQEFFAGSADQSIAEGATNHGRDKSGMDNGNYSRIDATYSSTLDSGIEVAGVYTVTARDCQGSRQGNCGVVNYNNVSLSGGFGTIGIGEKFDVGASMLSRLTAGVPTGEPDGGQLGQFYTSSGDATYGSSNEVNYADNSVKLTYNSNVYSGFSFAVGYTPNMASDGAADDAQATTVTRSAISSYSDVLSTYAKYHMEMDGVGLTLVYGQQAGNAGQQSGTNYNDLEETVYSAAVSYAGLTVDYRKNEADNSGQQKNGNAGNNEGTSVCAKYTMGNIGLGACQVETSFTDTSNLENSSETRTYSADYALGGGMTIGLVYFDVEQTANSVTKTDVDGLMSKLSVGF